MWNQIVSIFMVETTSNESDPFPPAGIKNDLWYDGDYTNTVICFQAL